LLPSYSVDDSARLGSLPGRTVTGTGFPAAQRGCTSALGPTARTAGKRGPRTAPELCLNRAREPAVEPHPNRAVTLLSTNAATALFLVAALLLRPVASTEGGYVEGCPLTLQQLATWGLPRGLGLFHLG
jgi:hypothetical protein